MSDDYYARKMKTVFQYHDINKDGVITREDYEEIARRFIASGNLVDERAAEVKASLLEIWETYLKDPKNGEPINEDGFVALFRKQFDDSEHRDQISKHYHGGFETLFKVIDANADHLINLSEYEQFFENYGIDKSHASTSFEALDSDKDKLISLDEFVAAGVDFFLSDEENRPSSLFWGPLI